MPKAVGCTSYSFFPNSSAHPLYNTSLLVQSFGSYCWHHIAIPDFILFLTHIFHTLMVPLIPFIIPHLSSHCELYLMSFPISICVFLTFHHYGDTSKCHPASLPPFLRLAERTRKTIIHESPDVGLQIYIKAVRLVSIS